MRRTVNEKWYEEKKRQALTILALGAASEHIDETISFNKAAQALVVLLSNKNIPFKVFNLGAGVKRITTETDVCPCCKKKL